MTKEEHDEQDRIDAYVGLAELERLNEKFGGICCVECIITCLKDGYFEDAVAIRRNEGDKTRQWDEIEEQLHKMFGCRSHQVHDCEDWLCKSIREERLKRLERK